MLRMLFAIGFGAVLLGAGGAKFFSPGAKSPAPSAALVQPANASADAAAAPKKRSGTAIIPAGRSGHFHTNATIGGRSVDFMVDTGASIIALTYQDAKRLGIRVEPRDFKDAVRTASGIVHVARVRLASVSIGSVTVQDVDGVVMPNNVMGSNLLGMSFLSRLRRYEFRSGQLILEQ